MERQIRTAPSILSADFSDLAAGLKTIEIAGGDWVHLDVMDGHFVPNLTFGPKMVADIRKKTELPLDVHLMIERPENSVKEYIRSGADYLTFHLEATVHAHRLVQVICELGAKPGIAIVPSTPVHLLSDLLPELDLVLVMTVNPGFGGQKIIPRCIRKIAELAEIRKRHGYSYLISVDGGIDESTAPPIREAGVDILVSGSGFFAAGDPGAYVFELKGGTIA